MTPAKPRSPDQAASRQRAAPHEQTEQYGGHIESRHGRINTWLLIVYAILFVWSLYYGFVYWGGLGPGLDY